MPALGPILTYGGENKKDDSLTGRERERIKTKGGPRRLHLSQLKKAGDFKSTCHVAPPNVDLGVALGARVTRFSLSHSRRKRTKRRRGSGFEPPLGPGGAAALRRLLGKARGIDLKGTKRKQKKSCGPDILRMLHRRICALAVQRGFGFRS